ncbi:hypothetical protein EPO33_02055 [Patescibacteria group bacterium]|nr:MAG: hypothetical protein EPO33_02055 [Patescibacteria group bacterium]
MRRLVASKFIMSLPSTLVTRIHRSVKGKYDSVAERQLTNALLPLVVRSEPRATAALMWKLYLGVQRKFGDFADLQAPYKPEYHHVDRLMEQVETRAMMRFRADALEGFLRGQFGDLGLPAGPDLNIREVMLTTDAGLGAHFNAGLDGVDMRFLDGVIRIPSRLLETIRLAQVVEARAERLDMDELNQWGDAMWEKIRLERRTGVKACYSHSDLLVPPNDVIAFAEQDDGGNEWVNDRFGERTCCLIFSCDMRRARNARPRAANSLELHGQPVCADRVWSWGEDVVTWSLWNLGLDGHLSMGFSQVGVREVCEANGLHKAYPLWRLLLLTRVHDLVVPVSVADALPPVDALERELAAGGGIPEAITARLAATVMPRIQRPPSDAGSIEQPLRTVRRHGVTWFVRQLPKSYHPSLRAVALAAEHGIALGEHETFVRAHERGTGDEPLPVREVKFDR